MKGSGHKDSPPRKSNAREAERKRGSPPRQLQSRKRSISPPRKPSPKTKVTSSSNDPYKGITLEVTLKNDLALRGNTSRRKDSPVRRGGSSDHRNRRSTSRTRRRSPAPRPPAPTRRSRPRSPSSRPSTSSRARTPERKKEDDRKKDDRRDRKTDYREKKDTHDDVRSRLKARELRDVAREKERLEALERCRERQREREQKEKDRLREERERKDPKRNSRDNISRSSTVSSDKRHERGYDRFERIKGTERDRSYERERVRDRALERMMERKSVDRNRERSRDRYADRGYNDSRRVLQAEEKTYSSSPYRGNERSRYEGERERLSPRDDRLSRGVFSEDRRDRGRSRGWPSESQASTQSSRYEEPPSREREKPHRSSAGGEWTGERVNDFQEANTSRNREWESSRIRDEGADDWSGYERSSASDWHNRPHPHHHHIDDRRERRHGSEPNEKEVHPPVEIVKDKDSVLGDSLGKRISSDEAEEPVKRPRLSEPATFEELSDISDGPDDILNRDDIEFIEGEDSRMGDSSQAAPCDTSGTQPDRSEGHLEDSLQASSPNLRLPEDDNMVGLDFEEISDEELEEESKTNKGGSVADALGVDWASLMAECRPQKKKPEENGERGSSVRVRWEPSEMLSRLGVSTSLASPEYIKKLNEKYPQLLAATANKTTTKKNFTGIAAFQRMMAQKKKERENNIAIAMENKQALSARADIAIRRRLCGLPVISLEAYNTTGFCPWAV